MDFIDAVWKSYDRFRVHPEGRQEQVSSLYPTGLYEGQDGLEYCFLPTKNIKQTEEDILEQYQDIKVIDHSIMLCNEVYFTTKIEGAKTTISRTIEIHNGKPVDHSNYFSEMMVQSSFRATKYLNERHNIITMDSLLEMWNIIIDGCCENEDIRGDRFRTGFVQVGNHAGLHPDLVENAMEMWVDYHNSDQLCEHPFIKAALLHLVFEMIHPFCDGNGRAGRLLMINYLIGQGLNKCKAVSFSKRIAASIHEYYNALTISENAYGDCTPFIEYMMEVFLYTFFDANDNTTG